MTASIIPRVFRRFEDGLAFILLLVLSGVPIIEAGARIFFKTGIPNSSEYLQHLVLWIAFIGGMITSREKRHLSLTAGIDKLGPGARGAIRTASALISSAICTAFAWCALSLIAIGFDSSMRIGIFPIRLVGIIMPFGYAVMAARFVTVAELPFKGKLIASAGFVLGTFFSVPQIASIVGSIAGSTPAFLQSLSAFSHSVNSTIALPLVILLVISAFLETPVFIILGGCGYLFFMRSGGSLEVISNEAYTLLISQSIPAIPLFALTGFILSESKAGERLIHLFRAFLGWLPGGMVIMVVLVCAFFTTFTGASGVTILALGGLLSYILINSGKYPESFTRGLLTSTGSIGLLFPPSLPVILYGVMTQISIKKLYIAGILPGLFMMTVVIIMGIVVSVRSGVERVPFDIREALKAFRESFWELLIPVVILGTFFGGLTNLVETAAVSAAYALVVTLVIHRDFTIKMLPGVFLKCIPIVGGILVILALAKGLSFYIVDAEIPQNLSVWTKAHIHSPYVFLVILNVALLVTGCLMDIYSAIMVVVPLIIPLGEAFGIDPVHMGIIFLANLELGYLTPPVGLNLFLASYLFNKPLGRIYRDTWPFLLLLLVTVIVITYVPWISTVLATYIE